MDITKKIFFFKNYIQPIILTLDKEKYINFSSKSNFLDIYSIEIIDGKVKIKFGKKGFSGIDIRVIIDCLTEKELNSVKNIVLKNNWKSPYYNPILP